MIKMQNLHKKIAVLPNARAATVVLGGCLFRNLGEDLSRVNSLAVLHGRVTTTLDRDDPLLVVPYGRSGGQTIDFFVLSRPVLFLFGGAGR